MWELESLSKAHLLPYLVSRLGDLHSWRLDGWTFHKISFSVLSWWAASAQAQTPHLAPWGSQGMCSKNEWAKVQGETLMVKLQPYTVESRRMTSRAWSLTQAQPATYLFSFGQSSSSSGSISLFDGVLIIRSCALPPCSVNSFKI